MDDPDPYYYSTCFHTLPRLGADSKTCKLETPFEHLQSYLSTLKSEEAVLEFLIKLQDVYNKNVALNNKPRKGRPLPPVPKFEDSATEPAPVKKLKQANHDQATPNAIAAISSGKMRIESSSSTPEAKTPDDVMQKQTPTGKQSELLGTTEHQSYLSQNGGTIDEEQKNHLVTDSFRTDSHMSQILGDSFSKPSAKTANQPTGPSCDSNDKQVLKEVQLDKKDLKKFHRFENCLQEYLQKLSITNPAVEQKYLELLRLVVPQLSTHFKSKPFEAIAAAILLYACREVQYPITVKQIIQATDAKEKLVNKCIFSIKEVIPHSEGVKHFKADEFIIKIGDKLLVNDVIKQTSLKIHQNIQSLNFIKSNHAATLACCCIKFACALSSEDKGFDEIAEAASINKMTLRNMYRELYPYRFRFLTSECCLVKTPADLPNI